MRLSQICIAIAQLGRGGAWSPLALWPDGILSPGMWISPRDLTSEWADYTGTTPVVTPGTVADSANPVGLALDIRAGATVLTDPGNHMLQSTSAARPLMSARVNTLTYTEDFSNAIWVIDAEAGNTVTKTLGQTDPLGGTSAARLVMNYYSGAYYQCAFRYNGGLAAEQVKRSWWIKSNTGDAYNLYLGDTQITTIADTNWHRYDVSESMYSWGTRIIATSANVDITVAFPQREFGDAATPYQSVPGDGSTYATDFPIFQKYDGVDDGMATATFPAGTLIDGMDCQIAVRRANSSDVIMGLISADTAHYFGKIITWLGGSTAVNCGTPSVLVDGVAITDVVSALAAAMTVGEWHILEYQNLDLSMFTGASYGIPPYAGYAFNGHRGDILLYPSTTPTTDKDAARQWLADYYGVTLP